MSRWTRPVVLFFLIQPIFLALLLSPSSSLFPSLDPLENEPSDSSFSSFSHKYLLLTAHPDDECMFFAPTLLALAQSESSDVYSLCLSVGNADGLGDVRAKELERSLDVLGISEGRRWVVDRPDLMDNIMQHWDREVIAEVVKPYVVEHNITTILTFDEGGISSHPNHISLPAGAGLLLARLNPTRPRPVRLFSLVTVPVIPKYTGMFSVLYAKATLHLREQHWSYLKQPDNAVVGAPLVSIAGIREYITALNAMMQHRSQLVWFRWLYVTYSRYMWVNDWVEVDVSLP